MNTTTGLEKHTMDNPTILIPLYYVLGLAGGFAISAMMGLLYWMDIKRYVPEAKIFKKARRKGLPVLDRQDIGSGYGRFLLGKKQKPDDIAFDDEDLPGLMVDASILGEADATHYERGLDIYHYASTQWMPLTTINALGFKTIKRLINEKYKDLSFLPDEEICELLSTKSQEQLEDCETVIKKYSPTLVDNKTGVALVDPTGNSVWMTGRDLSSAITELREESKITPIDTGIFSYKAAFIMNPVSHQSQDLEQLRMLIELMLRAEYEKILKLMPYVIMALMLIAAMVVGVAALYMTIGNK
jgi:hypothetical protein